MIYDDVHYHFRYLFRYTTLMSLGIVLDSILETFGTNLLVFVAIDV